MPLRSALVVTALVLPLGAVVRTPSPPATAPAVVPAPGPRSGHVVRDAEELRRIIHRDDPSFDDRQIAGSNGTASGSDVIDAVARDGSVFVYPDGAVGLGAPPNVNAPGMPTTEPRPTEGPEQIPEVSTLDILICNAGRPGPPLPC